MPTEVGKTTTTTTLLHVANLMSHEAETSERWVDCQKHDAHEHTGRKNDFPTKELGPS